MKRPENNEIDLLLRDLANRQVTAGTLEAEAGDAHLDADALSAFAEGTLPPAARSDYIAHAADCGRCRRILSQLVFASGVAVQAPQSPVQGGSLWKFVASLLSPPVLRYAIPSLSLLVVAVIGFTLLRREPATELAKVTQPTATSETAPQEPAAPGFLADDSLETQQGNRSLARTNEQRRAEVDKSSPRNKTNVDQLVSAEKSKDDAPKEAPMAEEPASRMASVEAAPPPKPEPAGAVQQEKGEAFARPQTAATDAVSRSEDEQLRRDREKAGRDADVDKKAAPAPGQQIQGRYASRELKSKQDANEESTRSVAGRRFRREGNVWIDTDYNAGAATTSVVRGSEQYRALVADEPGIRTIAEQLKGEIILVWKGRTYRIR